jgi:hypothetical protein
VHCFTIQNIGRETCDRRKQRLHRGLEILGVGEDGIEGTDRVGSGPVTKGEGCEKKILRVSKEGESIIQETHNVVHGR